MYAEFGTTSTDTISMTLEYHALGLTTAKTFNILARQISCTAPYKAPTDCTQYFTGVSGNVQSYNFEKFLKAQYYTNCIRTEKGYCAIQWKESSIASPDPFGIGAAATAAAGGAAAAGATACPLGFLAIPDLSMDGYTSIGGLGDRPWQSIMCGAAFGVSSSPVPSALITRKQPFIVGVYSSTSDQPAATTGFNLDYTQIPC